MLHEYKRSITWLQRDQSILIKLYQARYFECSDYEADRVGPI